MSRPEPKFAVFEVVATRFDGPFNSNSTPVLERRFAVNEPFVCPSGRIANSTGWVYLIGIGGQEKWADENRLRPRPKPATQSFTELVAELKTAKPDVCVPA